MLDFILGVLTGNVLVIASIAFWKENRIEHMTHILNKKLHTKKSQQALIISNPLDEIETEE